MVLIMMLQAKNEKGVRLVALSPTYIHTSIHLFSASTYKHTVIHYNSSYGIPYTCMRKHTNTDTRIHTHTKFNTHSHR